MRNAKLNMLHIIHLPDRTDRWTLLLKELERQGISDYKIWPGVKTARPSVGIAMAHQQIVKWAIQENLPEITIAEDDVLFTADEAFNTTCKTNLQLLISIWAESHSENSYMTIL